MSNTGVSINERAFNEAIYAGLAAVGSLLVSEVAKVTPRSDDISRLPIHNIDRKDGKRPMRRRNGYLSIREGDGHWYYGVTGNLQDSIAHEVDTSSNKVYVGVSEGGPTPEYGAALEFGTPRIKMKRSFLRQTIDDPIVQEILIKEFERAFYMVLEKYNR